MAGMVGILAIFEDQRIGQAGVRQLGDEDQHAAGLMGAQRAAAV